MAAKKKEAEGNGFMDSYAVSVTIEGVCPILLHKYDIDDVEEKKEKGKGSKASKTDNLNAYVYRNKERQLCVPGLNIKAAMREAARREKDPSSPRRSAKDLFRAAITVDPFLIPFSSKATEWDAVDTRPVVIQRARVPRSRPMMLEPWELEFTINVLDAEYISTELLERVLQKAGVLEGLCDFRPDFGRFKVTKFEPIEQ